MSNQLLSPAMKTITNLREEPCLTLVNVHKTSLLSKSPLRQVQKAVIDVQAFRRVDEAIQNEKS